MQNTLLSIKDLNVSTSDIQILNGVSLDVAPGETHVLMGPNGAGKSTLGYVIAGNPIYSVNSGSILFNGMDITDEPADKRAVSGIFLSFQNPLEVPGITLANFIRTAYEQRTGEKVRLWPFRQELKKKMKLLEMDESYADRDLNVGFSGGEKKKAEILQLLMLKPKLAILDETDSGLDVDAVRTVSRGVKAYQEEIGGSLIIITHITRILEALKVNKTHIMVNGRIVHTGGPDLVEEITRNGFENYENK